MTSGAVAGLGVVLRALLGRGDRVVVESPTYPNTVDALRRGGARLVPLAMDRDGWDVDRDRRARVRSAGAAAAFLIPDFHNPTGALCSATTTGRGWPGPCAQAGTVPVVDETIAEVALDADLALPRPVRRPRPADGQRRQLVEVALGRPAHRVDPRPALRARPGSSSRGSRPTSAPRSSSSSCCSS